MNCPWCGSQVGAESLLGTLGLLAWYRCRYCGGQFNKKARSKWRKKKEAT